LLKRKKPGQASRNQARHSQPQQQKAAVSLQQARLYTERRRIENAFGRLKDFRRLATRYDRLARNFLASVYIVAALI
jgi:transposase